eukprot:GHVL01021673.1.p1 GENE.GHVL01021673.1~~GHVL01021673.1.p1  ORF type:complete len:289 (+),score=32.92 GHVL01021673.1:832-1698(+)
MKDIPPNEVSCILHFTNPEMQLANKYSEIWCNSEWASSAMHVMCNRSNESVSNIATHTTAHSCLHRLMNSILPSIFKLPDGDKPMNTQIAVLKDTQIAVSKENKKISEQSNTLYPPMLWMYVASPISKSGPDTSSCLETRWPSWEMVNSSGKSSRIRMGAVLDSEMFREARADATKIIQNIGGVIESYPRILFLGTGAAIPSNYRNVSGILVYIRSDSSILFDCGESTLSQLRMIVGEKDYLKVLFSIRVICISHSHADHHLGCTTILSEICQRFPQSSVYMYMYMYM